MRSNLFSKTKSGFASFVTVHFLFAFLQLFQNEVLLSEAENYIKNMRDIIPKPINVFKLSSEDEQWIEKTLESMTLYDKCAQIFMPAVFGKSLDQSSKEFKLALELVRECKVGGVVISTGNVEETASMINELQKNSGIPLLISADFENGIGMRMNASNTFPHNMAVGSTYDPDLAYSTGQATSNEALLLGVNVNFAPVADINNNPANPVINLRSYSEDKNIVTDFCKKFVDASIDGGVIATAKHFPGHGNTMIDSHNDLPIITGSKNYLFENELKPFIELIENGVQAIMIGHLNVPAFDSRKDLPASLSYNIITKLLKEKLEFKGLIITDALDMKAVINYFSASDVCLQAFKAGNDILLMPSDIKIGITAIYDAVKSGNISENRLNESVRKILSAKKWLKLERESFKTKKIFPKRIRIEEHYQLSKNIAEKSVTIVKSDSKLIPLDSVKYTKTLLINMTNRKIVNDPHFNESYKENFAIYSSTNLTSTSKSTDYQYALDIAKDCEMVLIASYFGIRADANGKALSNDQIKFIENILALNKKVIIISFENPYILSLFPYAENYICTFSNSKASQRAVVNLLNGSIEANGRLPVSIPNTNYKIGYKWKPSILLIN